jgi:hypothetical protein
VYITPPAIQNIGYKTYIIFAVLNATWVPIIVCASNPDTRKTNDCSQYIFYPETKGMALEDVDHLFAKHEEAQRQLSVTEIPKTDEKISGDSLQRERVVTKGSAV